MLTFEQMKTLRGEIVLNSLFTSDYKNSLGILPEKVQIFFDSYLDSCAEIDKELGFSDIRSFSDFLLYYDDIQMIYDYYMEICDFDALPIEKEV